MWGGCVEAGGRGAAMTTCQQLPMLCNVDRRFCSCPLQGSAARRPAGDCSRFTPGESWAQVVLAPATIEWVAALLHMVRGGGAAPAALHPAAHHIAHACLLVAPQGLTRMHKHARTCPGYVHPRLHARAQICARALAPMPAPKAPPTPTLPTSTPRHEHTPKPPKPRRCGRLQQPAAPMHPAPMWRPLPRRHASCWPGSARSHATCSRALHRTCRTPGVRGGVCAHASTQEASSSCCNVLDVLQIPGARPHVPSTQ